MQWKNTTNRFGFIAVALHWLVALTVFNLFVLGLWMTGLDYYDSWYKLGPWLHKSVGMLLFLIVLLRLSWRIFTPPPGALLTHKLWEVRLAHVVHLLLYWLLLAIMISGYLISTADGRSIGLFDWFFIPATITSIPQQEDNAGWIHLMLASILMGLVLLHAAAALKHHFIDRDRTLIRIFGK